MFTYYRYLKTLTKYPTINDEKDNVVTIPKFLVRVSAVIHKVEPKAIGTPENNKLFKNTVYYIYL